MHELHLGKYCMFYSLQSYLVAFIQLKCKTMQAHLSFSSQHSNLSVQVLLNGRKSSNMSYGVSAYVTQDEVLVGVLSVRETIM